MKGTIFITGTDTGVGKTVVTGLLARFLSGKGSSVITQKWVQTGSSSFPEDIAVHLDLIKRERTHFAEHMKDAAPYVLSFPASPHLAAEKENISIDPEKIKDSFYALAGKFDFVVAEGSGGLKVPLDEKVLIEDILGEIKIPSIVVAANRLGAVNHTLLTVDALKQKEIPVIGIIFNRFSSGTDDLVLEDNKDIVEKISGVKVLGELVYNEDVEELYQSFLPIGDKVLGAFRVALTA